MLKRVFDLTVSFTGIALTAPVLLGTSVLISKKLGKPVLFKQTRPGKDEIPFSIYKFRTMTNETDEKGVLLPNELRMTRLGSFIRKTSIDELPQLINVIKGDLSLVGPRPLLIEYLPLYSDFQRKRMDVKPGITGWAQINGRNAISWEKKFELDVWYVENQSFKLDMYILYKTFTSVLKRKDINANNNITMEKFKGSQL
ncbi:sugar transferase [Staphylococcus equorum]|uniref:sugar transferase n=1 Tax=Staphylococcus equorum TaxID=246432 RepID=UPI00101C8E67|nr:sugar transferase [Staphylococcus equorum]MEB7690485.1 sugar transferase [Staphylococcus equorum]MEB7852538.1 sugar transferase [Staphylococcus equorum]QQB59156.1 sugar transferase [Staphylococcus equorum]RYD13458.1 sugar transferase [Staphylococcus equorum]